MHSKMNLQKCSKDEQIKKKGHNPYIKTRLFAKKILIDGLFNYKQV